RLRGNDSCRCAKPREGKLPAKLPPTQRTLSTRSTQPGMYVLERPYVCSPRPLKKIVWGSNRLILNLPRHPRPSSYAALRARDVSRKTHIRRQPAALRHTAIAEGQPHAAHHRARRSWGRKLEIDWSLLTSSNVQSSAGKRAPVSRLKPKAIPIPSEILR